MAWSMSWQGAIRRAGAPPALSVKVLRLALSGEHLLWANNPLPDIFYYFLERDRFVVFYFDDII